MGSRASVRNQESGIGNQGTGRGRRVIVQIVVRLVKSNLHEKRWLLSGSAGECLGFTGCQRGFGGNLWPGEHMLIDASSSVPEPVFGGSSNGADERGVQGQEDDLGRGIDAQR